MSFNEIIRGAKKNQDKENKKKQMDKLSLVMNEIQEVLTKHEVNTYEFMDILTSFQTGLNIKIAKMLQNSHVKITNLQKENDKLKQ